MMQLDLENLKVLDDGRLAAAFEQELRHVVLDLMDRPGDDRERSVTWKVKLKHGEIPESIEMDLPIFCGEPFDRFRYRISVSIDIDSASERIRFIPRGDDLGRCFQKAGEYLASEIHERLSGQLVVVGTI